MRNATMRQLRVFSAVARHLSFGKAAEELHLTPPAVSMQIKELEQLVGLPLFDRGGRSVALTMTGEYLLVYVRKILATLKDADDALARFRGLQTGRLTIGMVSTAKYFVPRLMARFRAEHPGVEVRLEVGGNREQLVGLLQANEVDLAIMGRPPREMATRAEPFAVHPHVIVTPRDHPLIRVGHAPPAALGDYEFLIREPGSGTRAAMEKFFADHRLTPRVAMEMSSNETIKQAVMAGMGISFLSLHTIGIELKAGLIAVADIDGLPLLKRWYIVSALARTLSPAAEAFRYFMLEEAERYLAREYGAAIGADAREPA
jgi:DNA-binding transcriptional LysR family regulator